MLAPVLEVEIRKWHNNWTRFCSHCYIPGGCTGESVYELMPLFQSIICHISIGLDFVEWLEFIILCILLCNLRVSLKPKFLGVLHKYITAKDKCHQINYMNVIYLSRMGSHASLSVVTPPCSVNILLWEYCFRNIIPKDVSWAILELVYIALCLLYFED